MSTATQLAEAAPDRLELYQIRDDLAQTYNPANAHERLLLSQMAQAWRRLQRALEAEEKYYQTRDLFDAITNDYAHYKAISGAVVEAERFWRHSTLQLEKVQRRRKTTDLRSPNARRRPIEPQPVASVPHPPSPVRLTTDHSPLTTEVRIENTCATSCSPHSFSSRPPGTGNPSNNSSGTTGT